MSDNNWNHTIFFVIYAALGSVGFAFFRIYGFYTYIIFLPATILIYWLLERKFEIKTRTKVKKDEERDQH